MKNKVDNAKRGEALRLLRDVRWYEIGYGLCRTVFFTFAHYGILPYVTGHLHDFCLLIQRFCLPLTFALVLTLITIRKRPFLAIPGVLLAGVMQGGASILQGFSATGALSSMPFAVSASVLFGVSSGLFMILWHHVFGSMKPFRAGAVMSMSWMLSAVLSLILFCLPMGITVFLCAVLLPALSVITLVLSLRRARMAAPAFVVPSIVEVLPKLWKPAIGLMIFSLLWQTLTWFADARSVGSDIGLHVFSLPLALVMLIGVLWGKADSDAWYKRMMPIAATLYLAFPFLTEWLGYAFELALFACFEMLCLSLMCICARVSQNNKWEPQVVFAVALFPEVMGLGLGYGSGMLLFQANADSLFSVVSVSLGALYLLGIGYVVIEGRRHPKAGQVAAVYGNGVLAKKRELLTPREAEVLDYLVRGYSVPVIGRLLGLSPNTVKGNVSRIYAKLDVHSKQELIELANGLAASDEDLCS